MSERDVRKPRSRQAWTKIEKAVRKYGPGHDSIFDLAKFLQDEAMVRVSPGVRFDEIYEMSKLCGMDHLFKDEH